MRIACKDAKAEARAGVGLLAVRATSVEEHAPTHAHTASHARTHARHEHETKPKPISRLGSTASIIPPNLRHFCLHYDFPYHLIT